MIFAPTDFVFVFVSYSSRRPAVSSSDWLGLMVGFRVGVDLWLLASALANSLRGQKALGSAQSDWRLSLDLRAKPDAELENVLELI